MPHPQSVLSAYLRPLQILAQKESPSFHVAAVWDPGVTVTMFLSQPVGNACLGPLWDEACELSWVENLDSTSELLNDKGLALLTSILQRCGQCKRVLQVEKWFERGHDVLCSMLRPIKHTCAPVLVTAWRWASACLDAGRPNVQYALSSVVTLILIVGCFWVSAFRHLIPGLLTTYYSGQTMAVRSR